MQLLNILTTTYLYLECHDYAQICSITISKLKVNPTAGIYYGSLHLDSGPSHLPAQGRWRKVQKEIYSLINGPH